MEQGLFWCGYFDDKLARLSLRSNITDKRGTTILSCWKISMMDVLNNIKFVMLICWASSGKRDLFWPAQSAVYPRSIPAYLYHCPVCISLRKSEPSFVDLNIGTRVSERNAKSQHFVSPIICRGKSELSIIAHQRIFQRENKKPVLVTPSETLSV